MSGISLTQELDNCHIFDPREDETAERAHLAVDKYPIQPCEILMQATHTSRAADLHVDFLCK